MLSLKSKQGKVIAVLAFLAIGLGSYALWVKGQNRTPVQTTDQVDSASPENSSENNSKFEPPSGSKNPGTTTDPVPTKTAGSVTITSISADASRVYVRTVVSEYTSGSCEFVFSMPGRNSITKTGKVAFSGPDIYYCSPFSFNRSEFPVNGNWAVAVTVKSGDKQAATKGSLELE